MQAEVEGGEGSYSDEGNGGNGGSASASIGSGLTLTDSASFNVYGGEASYGGEDSDNGVCGTGGNASLVGNGPVSVWEGTVRVEGGDADESGYGAAGVTEGAGGNASVSIVGSLNASELDFYGEGGWGGYDYNEGNGGAGGSVSLTVSGGMTAEDSYLYLKGGKGGSAEADGATAESGAGGLVSLNVAGAVSIDDSQLIVEGGDSNSCYGQSNSVTEGVGGAALASMASLSETGGSYINIQGGVGGTDTGKGSGGNGGSASLTISGPVSVDASTVTVVGGTVGAGDKSYGGNGGNASVSIGSGLTVNRDYFIVTGGTGGNSTSGNGGNGGDASLIATALTMSSGTTVVVQGGTGGTGSTNGTNGTASMTLNTLSGSGYLDVAGTAASLQVQNGDFGGVIDGNETLNKTGSGALTLTGANTYSGGTLLESGLLAIGNDGALGAGRLTLEDGTTLRSVLNNLVTANAVSLIGNDTFDSNNSNSLLLGVISGTGSLTKISAGSLILAADNTYSGGTTVGAGTLVAANTNALGTGSVAVTGGTLSVSGPITLNIGGNYTQSSTGTLQLGLGGTALGLWDKLNVAGTATLAGTLKLTPYNGFQIHDNETFTIITAGSVTGTFNPVSDTVDGVAVSVIYQPDDVLLEAGANAPTFASIGQTTNQTSIGGVLDGLAANSGKPDLINYLNTLSDSQLVAVYNELSPSNLTPIYKMGFLTAQGLTDRIVNRIGQLLGSSYFNSNNLVWNNKDIQFAGNLSPMDEAQIAANVRPVNRWDAFLDGQTNWGTVTSDGNGEGYQFSTTGSIAGLDYRFSKNLVGGVLIGYDQSNTTQSTGTVNATRGQLGVYAGWKVDELHAEALFDGGLDSYTTQRTALEGTANGSTSGLEYTGQLNVGYDWKLNNFRISPFATGQYTQVNVNGFSETGSLAPLTFPNQGEGYMSSDMGSQFVFNFKAGEIKLSPYVSASWEHVYEGNNDSLSANFGSGSDFTVSGSSTGTDAAVLGGGLDAQLDKDWNVYGEYEGKVGMTNYTSQSLMVGVHLSWGGKTEPQAQATPIPVVEKPVFKANKVVTPVATEAMTAVPTTIATPVTTEVETPVSQADETSAPAEMVTPVATEVAAPVTAVARHKKNTTVTPVPATDVTPVATTVASPIPTTI
jgi:autotransporter-associated beta strand protein